MGRLTGVASIHICMQLRFFLHFLKNIGSQFPLFLCYTMMVKIFQKNSEDTGA